MKEIKPINNRGSIQLKFTFQGHRYTFNPIPGSQYDNAGDMAKVKDVATQISLDIRNTCFDPTLDKYRPKQIVVDPPKKHSYTKLVDLWDEWVNTLNLSEENKACHYSYVRSMMIKTSPKITDDAQWFITSGNNLAASTWNLRLRLIKKCYLWALDCKKIDSDVFKFIRSKSNRVKRSKPFTKDEISRIIADLKKHNPTYAPFVAFLFSTGCRTSEAIGVQWRRIDLSRGEITLEDSTPISKVTNKPTRKSTKTGIITVLPMTDNLRKLLESIPMGGSEDLVFKSPEGKIINRRNFRARVWKPTLERLGIEYRKPYTTRHTLASHAASQGMPLSEISQLLGHSSIEMVSRHYVTNINRLKLPEINLD